MLIQMKTRYGIRIPDRDIQMMDEKIPQYQNQKSADYSEEAVYPDQSPKKRLFHCIGSSCRF